MMKFFFFSLLSACVAAVVIENDHVRFEFDDDYKLTNLHALSTGNKHIAHPSDWLAIQFVDHQGIISEVSTGSATKRDTKDRSIPGMTVRTFIFENLPVGKGSSARVEAEWQLRDDDSLATIRLNCIAEGMITFYNVKLAIGGLAVVNDANVLSNGGFGRSLQAEGTNFVFAYPGDATYQAVAHYAGSWGGGVYLAAEDPQGAPKSFGYQAVNGTAAMSISVLVPNAGKTTTYLSSYPFRFGVFNGDWFDAALIYRNWALAEAAWTRNRRTTPAWVYNMLFWVNSHWQENDIFNQSGGDPDMLLPRVNAVQHLFGLKPGEMALHWYEWDTLGYDENYTKCLTEITCGFDTHYPAYFPARKGFHEGVSTLQKQGVRVFPYINGRIHDQNVPEYSKALPYTSKQHGKIPSQPGGVYEEEYGSRAKFAVMCPATTYWQDIIADVASNIHELFQTDGVYIDQIGAASPQNCFDPSHGHPLGGGAHWVEGYHAMLQQVENKTGANFAIMTESNAEPYMNDLDLYLTTVSFDSSAIPFFPVIYGSYVLTAGSIFHLPDLDNGDFTLKMGRHFAWGTQLGWFALGGRDNQVPSQNFFDAIMNPHYGDQVAFVRQLLSYKRRANDWLQRGQMHRPPMRDTQGIVTAAWKQGNSLLVIVVQTRPEKLSQTLQLDLVKNYGMNNRTAGVQWAIDGNDHPLGTFLNVAKLNVELPSRGAWIANFGSPSEIYV